MMKMMKFDDNSSFHLAITFLLTVKGHWNVAMSYKTFVVIIIIYRILTQPFQRYLDNAVT